MSGAPLSERGIRQEQTLTDESDGERFEQQLAKERGDKECEGEKGGEWRGRGEERRGG